MPENKETDKKSFGEVWDRVATVTGWTKQGQLAEFLNITPQTVSGVKRRGFFPIDWAFKVASNYNVSTDWLLNGGENMLRPVSLLDAITLGLERKYNEPHSATNLCAEGSCKENPLGSQVVYSWPMGKAQYFGKSYIDLTLTADLFSEVTLIKNEFGYQVDKDREESFMLLLFSIIRLGTDDEIRIASEFLRKWVKKTDDEMSKNEQ